MLDALSERSWHLSPPMRLACRISAFRSGRVCRGYLSARSGSERKRGTGRARRLQAPVPMGVGGAGTSGKLRSTQPSPEVPPIVEDGRMASVRLAMLAVWSTVPAFHPPLLESRDILPSALAYDSTREPERPKSVGPDSPPSPFLLSMFFPFAEAFSLVTVLCEDDPA